MQTVGHAVSNDNWSCYIISNSEYIDETNNDVMLNVGPYVKKVKPLQVRLQL